MSTETKLWGLYVPGIDHCFAYSSKAECETHAAKYPAPAMVVEWPHSAEEHAAALLERAQRFAKWERCSKPSH